MKYFWILLLIPRLVFAACSGGPGPHLVGGLSLQQWIHNQCNWDVEFNANMSKLNNVCDMSNSSSGQIEFNNGGHCMGTGDFTVDANNRILTVGQVGGANDGTIKTICTPANNDCFAQFSNDVSDPTVPASGCNIYSKGDSMFKTCNAGSPVDIGFPSVVAFLGLGTPIVGTHVYCSDCNEASNPCTSGGNGTIAIRINGGTPKWKCL